MAVRRALAWMALGQGVFFVLQFVGSVVIARLLTPLDVGIFSVAMAAVGLVAVVQALGLTSYVVREPDLTADMLASASAINLITSIGLSLVIVMLGLVGGKLFAEPGVRDVLLVVAVVPIIGHFSFIPGAMLEREGNFRALALLKAGSTAFGVALTIVLALAGYRYMAFAYSQVAAAIVTNIATNVLGRRHIALRLSLSHWSGLSRFGLQIFAISGMNRIATRIQEIALGRIVGLPALGLFSRASSNHAMLWDSIHTVVGRVVLVDFSRQARSGGDLRTPYLKILELMTGLLWPVFIGAGILAGPLISTIYGPKWNDAAPPFALLCVASTILVSTTMAWEIFVVCHQTARQARLELLRTSVGTVLFVAGCLISLEAAAASRILDALLVQMLYRPHLEQMTGARRRDFVAVYMRSAAPTLAAIIPSLVLMASHRFATTVPTLEVLVSVAAGVALWLIAMRLLDHELLKELTRLTSRLFPIRAAVK